MIQFSRTDDTDDDERACGAALLDLRCGMLTVTSSIAPLYNLDPDTAGLGVCPETAMKAVHRDDVDVLRRSVQTHIETGTFFSMRYRVSGNRGVRWVHAEGQCLSGPDGRPTVFATMIREVTDTVESGDMMDVLGNYLLEAFKVATVLELATVRYALATAFSDWGASRNVRRQ